MVEKSGGSAADITVSCSTKDKSAYEWHEIKSDSGSSYFWNTKTNGKLITLTIIIKY